MYHILYKNLSSLCWWRKSCLLLPALPTPGSTTMDSFLFLKNKAEEHSCFFGLGMYFPSSVYGWVLWRSFPKSLLAHHPGFILGPAWIFFSVVHKYVFDLFFFLMNWSSPIPLQSKLCENKTLFILSAAICPVPSTVLSIT